MLSFGRVGRVFLARQPQDMRRGIDSLCLVVQRDLGHDPMAGDCFVFVSRDRRRLKALLWEDGGFWLCLKRLERGTFADPARRAGPEQSAIPITPAAMHALLEGIDVQAARYRRRASGHLIITECLDTADHARGRRPHHDLPVGA